MTPQEKARVRKDLRVILRPVGRTGLGLEMFHSSGANACTAIDRHMTLRDLHAALSRTVSRIETAVATRERKISEVGKVLSSHGLNVKAVR